MSGSPVFTPSMLASALKHYEEREAWTRLRVHVRGKTMMAVVVFQSSKKDKEGRPLVHRTREDFCSCPGFGYHRGVCAHWIALRMEIEQARRLAGMRRPQPAERSDITSAF